MQQKLKLLLIYNTLTCCLSSCSCICNCCSCEETLWVPCELLADDPGTLFDCALRTPLNCDNSSAIGSEPSLVPPLECIWRILITIYLKNIKNMNNCFFKHQQFNICNSKIANNNDTKISIAIRHKCISQTNKKCISLFYF